MIGSFGGPDRDDSVEYPSSPAVDETSEDHPGVVHGRALKGSTDDSPESTECDCLDTSIFVTKPTTNETTDERSNVINADNSALKELIVDDWSALYTRCVRTFMAELHDILIVILGIVDTTLHEVSVILLGWDGKLKDCLPSYPGHNRRRRWTAHKHN